MFRLEVIVAVVRLDPLLCRLPVLEALGRHLVDLQLLVVVVVVVGVAVLAVLAAKNLGNSGLFSRSIKEG